MSRFTSVKRINTRWRNNDFIGEPGSSHTFADALHEEFLVDWAHQIQIGDIVITETPTTGNIQMATLTVGDLVLTGTATGNFGAGATVVQGTAPISVSTSSNTSIVSIDQTAITAAAATFSETLRAYVKNTTGATIPKGSVVYISGSTGDNALISLSTASTEAGSSKTLGITQSAITNDGFGYVIENGLLAGIDTSTATAGQSVWLGNTPGSFVFGAPPAEPSHGVYLGVVIRVQQNNGEILVKVQNGYEIDELHDVSAASPTNGDILQYNSTSGLWEKESLSTAGIAAAVHTHAYQPFGTYVTAVTGASPIAASTDTAGAVTVSLSANYQTAGTYVTAVNGTAPITASTTTAGVVTVALSASYDSAGTASSLVTAHESDTTSVHGITNTANLLINSSGFVTISNASGTATTISSTTSTSPTDISGLTFTFTPTYDEDVFVQYNLVFTQSSAPTAQVDIISRIIVGSTIVSPQGGFTRLAANHSSPLGFTQSVTHTFAATANTSYTVKAAAYKSAAQGTFSASNISSFSIFRVRA